MWPANTTGCIVHYDNNEPHKVSIQVDKDNFQNEYSMPATCIKDWHSVVNRLENTKDVIYIRRDKRGSKNGDWSMTIARLRSLQP